MAHERAGDRRERAALLPQIIRYLPANLVSPLISVATIAVFTRIMDAASYGAYMIALTGVLIGQQVMHYWVKVALTRFYAECAGNGRDGELLRATYLYLAATTAVAAIVAALILSFAPVRDTLAPALWAALPYFAFRSLALINAEVHRARLEPWRYTMVESGQNLAGFALALVFAAGFGWGAAGILLGFASGSAAVVLLDARLALHALRNGRPDAALRRELARFGLPLALSFALYAVVKLVDRFLIELHLGTADVGVYAAASQIVERAVAAAVSAVELAVFPLLVSAHARARQAGAAQLGWSAAALASVLLPAAVGLVLVREHLAAVLVGPAFRPGVAGLIPWLVLAAAASAISALLFDQVFHLAKRSTMFLMTNGVAAAVSVALNLVLLPRYGLLGAAYAAAAATLTDLALSALIGRRLARIPVPFGQLARVGAATAAMALALWAVPFPRNALGLLAMLAVGVPTYAAAALALNVLDSRAWMRRGMAARRDGAPGGGS